MPTTIKQTATFKASPHQVYELLMDNKKHVAFTGSAAKINRTIGGKFTAYGNYLGGFNLELVPDKKIVQLWRDNNWPKGHYSTATFELKKSGDETKLTFTQTDVPTSAYKDIKAGWVQYYWEPMKKYLEK